MPRLGMFYLDCETSAVSAPALYWHKKLAALIEQLDALRNPQEEARWLATAERQRDDIDKAEVEFFEKLRAPPAKREK